jgi:DNA-binding CsgD family transcriptional regulator
MNEPAIQYVVTTDGFRIAFTDCGAGVPLVLMPLPVNNLRLMWRMQALRPLFEALSERFRLIQYDPRGSGMSQRGLAESHSMADYELDLLAVVDALDLHQFLLLAPIMQAHVAVRYAVREPQRILRLVLWQLIASYVGGQPNYIAQLARDDWGRYLVMEAGIFAPGERLEDGLRLIGASVTQEDVIKAASVAGASNVVDLLPELQVQTLLLYKDMPFLKNPDWVKRAVTAITGAHLALLADDGDLYSFPRDPREFVAQIDEFLRSTNLDAGPGGPAVIEPASSASQSRLTPRETEILRLVAQGLTNKECAAALVLSERTVGRHITNIYAKIGVRSKAEATAYAIRQNLA